MKQPKTQPTQADIARKHGVSQQAVSFRIHRGQTLAEVDKALSQSLRAEPDATLKRAHLEEKCRLAAARRVLAQMDVSERKGELVRVDAIIAEIGRRVAIVRSMIDSAFLSELPARQGGLPSDQIASMNAERLDEIFAILGAPFTKGVE